MGIVLVHTGIDATIVIGACNIVSAENKNGATIVIATFSFAIIISYENQTTPVKQDENPEKSLQSRCIGGGSWGWYGW